MGRFSVTEEGREQALTIEDARIALVKSDSQTQRFKIQIVARQADVDQEAVLWFRGVTGTGESEIVVHQKVLEPGDGGFYFYSHCPLGDLRLDVKRDRSMGCRWNCTTTLRGFRSFNWY